MGACLNYYIWFFTLIQTEKLKHRLKFDFRSQLKIGFNMFVKFSMENFSFAVFSSFINKFPFSYNFFYFYFFFIIFKRTGTNSEPLRAETLSSALNILLFFTKTFPSEGSILCSKDLNVLNYGKSWFFSPNLLLKMHFSLQKMNLMCYPHI